jgi:uncharacterized protein (UPF0548 family)
VSFHIRRPTESRIAACLADGADAPFTYPEVGATRGGSSLLPASVTRDCDVDRYETVLGTGRAVFVRARAALLDWRSFGIRWLELHGAASPVREGRVVATLVRAAGVFSLNPCRVVYVIDAPDPPSCTTAFAYGTLPDHPEIGEERFLVAWDPVTNAVRYEILAFSRPGHPLVRLGYPYTRRLQKSFGASSLAALTRAVG